MLVTSYNPSSQIVLKRLKPSTRQRFLSIAFGFAESEAETRVITAETSLPAAHVVPLVRLAGHIRKLSGRDVEEGVSTRLLVYVARLVGAVLAATLLDGVSEGIRIYAEENFSPVKSIIRVKGAQEALNVSQ